MSFGQYFPVFQKLPAADQAVLANAAVLRSVKQDTLIHRGGDDCMGLILVRSGQLRAYITSDDGKEITIYRLFERDICMLTASCMLKSIQFDIMICAEKDTQFWIIPPNVYKELMERNVDIANFTNQIMATRLTDVMWLMEQVMWKSFDKRLAGFLLEECVLENTKQLKITHEKIAAHLGTAREVVTRMLKYFQTEGMVTLSRGVIAITNEDALEQLSQ